jgi:ADP-dependent NAD(P)H-hydrate dehydratase / NAD(P)H-hydrate epimerase
MKIVTVQQMQDIEKSADAGGLSYEQMMYNAGRGMADWLAENLDLRKGVVGLVGSGNNGGDTLIALTALSRQGGRTMAFLVKDRQDDPLLSAYSEQGGQVIDISQNENMDLLRSALQPGTVLLDGILGTGLRLPLRGGLQEVMTAIRKVVNDRPGVLVVAVDCPSGMDCDTGDVSGETLRADHTLCMAAIKQGLLKQPGRDHAGHLYRIGIGIGDIHEHISDSLPELVGEEFVRRYLPDRPADGHKGTFGTCQVIAGTRTFTGAAFLAGQAAYKAGCGLVDVATLGSVQNSLSASFPEAVWTLLPEMDWGYDPMGVGILEEKFQAADSLVIGPGFGVAESSQAFICHFFEKCPETCPVLVDADGLKLLSRLNQWWDQLPKNAILTPHPGEMAVLSGLTVGEIQADRWAVARRYAQMWDVILVLKGAETVIAAPDGNLFINPISDPALATAGSGDVLAGMIGGLLAQGCSPKAGSVAGVWLHSQAGLAAKKALGTDISVTAVDILNGIHVVFHEVKNGFKIEV